MGIHTYELREYDCIADETGWTVNDSWVLYKSVPIPDDAAPKEILQILKILRFLKTTDMRKLEVEDWGDNIEIIERKTHMPLYGLLLN